MRSLLTPHIIACEFAMVLNRKRPAMVQDTDVTIEFPYDIGTDSTGMSATVMEITVEVRPFGIGYLSMELDPFSERFVEPIVAALLNEFDKMAIASFDVRGSARH